MSTNLELSPEGRTLTVHVPLAFKRRGGRKQVVTPEGTPGWAPRPAQIDSTLVKAIARAHRWQSMLERGAYASVAELAAAEKINPSYLARILRLTLLAPEIVEGILDGRPGSAVKLDQFLRPFPTLWSAQQLSARRDGASGAGSQPAATSPAACSCVEHVPLVAEHPADR